MTVSTLALVKYGLVYLMAFSTQASPRIDISLIWSIEKTFELPESAVFDSKRNKIYVSNIVKYAKDGAGFISRVNGDGSNLELKWITGLNSPTGIAIYQDHLFVVDMDVLVVIDLEKGKIIKRIEAPKSEKPPLLNDIAIAKNGDIFISGSASRQIYQLRKDQLLIFVDDDQRLLKANGLLVDGNELIHGGQYWNRWDIGSGALISNSNSPSPASILSDFDGITPDGSCGYFVTVIEDERLWHVQKDGKTVPLSEEAIQGIDLYFDLKSNRLFVPQVGGGLSVYQVIRRETD